MSKFFTVWVGGVEINDSLLTREEAKSLADKYKKEGYDDVVIDMTPKSFAFFTELRAIVKEYKQGDEEPLDGDEVERLVKILHAKLDFIEGNITEEEYLNSF